MSITFFHFQINIFYLVSSRPSMTFILLSPPHTDKSVTNCLPKNILLVANLTAKVIATFTDIFLNLLYSKCGQSVHIRKMGKNRQRSTNSLIFYNKKKTSIKQTTRIQPETNHSPIRQITYSKYIHLFQQQYIA